MSKFGRRNARSVPLKGIHRLFSEAEQVRFIVARVHVGGSSGVWGGRGNTLAHTCMATLGTRREGRRVIDASRIHRPALGTHNPYTTTVILLQSLAQIHSSSPHE